MLAQYLFCIPHRLSVVVVFQVRVNAYFPLMSKPYFCSTTIKAIWIIILLVRPPLLKILQCSFFLKS